MLDGASLKYWRYPGDEAVKVLSEVIFLQFSCTSDAVYKKKLPTQFYV